MSLRQALLGHGDAFRAVFSESLLSFALGRMLDASHMPTARAVARQGARDQDRIQWRPDASRIVAAVAAVITALLLAWAIWQPEASDRATNDALALLDEKKFDAFLDGMTASQAAAVFKALAG